MKRLAALVLAVALSVPGSAHAQLPGTRGGAGWGPRIRFTPFVGVSPSAPRTENWTVAVPGQSESSTFRVSMGAGPAAGGVIELRLVERFGLMASAIYMSRGPTREVLVGEGDRFERTGSDLLIGKAGIALRLREGVSGLQFRRVSASLFGGPAFVEERPRADAAVSPILLAPIRHFGVNVGFDAEMPLGWDALALQAGFEDFIVWWNHAEYARRFDAVNAAGPAPLVTTTTITGNPSHLLMLRAGLVLRL